MSDLKFDTEEFAKSANEYLELADKMEKLKNDLAGDIAHLTQVEWVSEASKEFMNQYQNTWAENVMEYVTFLRYLKELMINAGNEYNALAEKLESVTFSNN